MEQCGILADETSNAADKNNIEKFIIDQISRTATMLRLFLFNLNGIKKHVIKVRSFHNKKYGNSIEFPYFFEADYFTEPYLINHF